MCSLWFVLPFQLEKFANEHGIRFITLGTLIFITNIHLIAIIYMYIVHTRLCEGCTLLVFDVCCSVSVMISLHRAPHSGVYQWLFQTQCKNRCTFYYAYLRKQAICTYYMLNTKVAIANSYRDFLLNCFSKG